MEENTTVRAEIARAIIDGFGGHATLQVEDERILVTPDGTQAPIVVLDDDVLLPERLQHLAGSIALDVQAILAMREVASHA